MDSSKNDDWKKIAFVEIDRSEAVVVFNEKLCLESENATWEIAVAKELDKPLVFLDSTNPNSKEIDTLCSVYHHDQEFDAYFRLKTRRIVTKKQDGGNEKEVIELYKVIVASSEQLIQRRQSMNAFFIAAIGSLLAFAGALIKFGNIESKNLSFLVVLLLSITDLILCYSWYNLIDNYGKLNKAKFRVINKIEEKLSVQIFSAEWVALGKGLRHDKYRSFTSTEKNIPKGFAGLVFFLFILSLWWYFGSSSMIENRDGDHTSILMCSTSVNLQKTNDFKPKKSTSQHTKNCFSNDRNQ